MCNGKVQEQAQQVTCWLVLPTHNPSPPYTPAMLTPLTPYTSSSRFTRTPAMLQPAPSVWHAPAALFFPPDYQLSHRPYGRFPYLKISN